MSGFFDRLIARHSDTGPVRPRVASRFEGPRVGAIPDARDLRVTAAAPNLRDGSVEAEPAASAHTGTLDGRRAVLERASPQRATVGATVPGVSLPPQSSPGVGTPMRRPLGGRKQGTTGDVHGAEEVPTPASTQRTVRPAVLLPRDGPMMATSNAAHAGAPEPAGADRASLAPQLSARRSTPVAPPVPDVVHVHIGRVEVRAVMPPAERPRAPQSKTPAALPLDRYLSGEGRR